MSRRYTYARTIPTVEGQETFTAAEWDSFDEAKTAVEKGIRDRKIELAQKYPAGTLGGAGITPGTTRQTTLTPPGKTSGAVSTGGKTSGATA